MNKTQYKLNLAKEIRELEDKLETKKMVLECLQKENDFDDYELEIIEHALDCIYSEQEDCDKEVIDGIFEKIVKEDLTKK